MKVGYTRLYRLYTELSQPQVGTSNPDFSVINLTIFCVTCKYWNSTPWIQTVPETNSKCGQRHAWFLWWLLDDKSYHARQGAALPGFEEGLQPSQAAYPPGG